MPAFVVLELIARGLAAELSYLVDIRLWIVRAHRHAGDTLAVALSLGWRRRRRRGLRSATASEGEHDEEREHSGARSHAPIVAATTPQQAPWRVGDRQAA